MARRSLPSLNALRALEAFARHGRMTLAADELCVTHGAVSRQIRQLEQQLGVALVEGPRNRPRMTLAAAQLAASAGVAFDGIELAMPRPAGKGAALKLSCIGTFAMKWLIPRLPGFFRDHPEIEVQVSEGLDLPDFAAGGPDLAIRIQNGPLPATITATPFLPNYTGPVLAPSLLPAGVVDMAALLALPRLQTRTRVQAWSEWAQAVGAALPRPSAIHVFEHNSYMLEAALAGLGVAVSPWANVIAEVQSGRLVAPVGFGRKSGDHVILRSASATDPRVGSLVRWLVDQGAATSGPPPVSGQSSGCEP